MQELMQIARQHPESVAFVFNQYGYGHIPVSGVSIHAMAVKFGHGFLQDLAAHIANEEQHSGFTSTFRPISVSEGLKRVDLKGTTTVLPPSRAPQSTEGYLPPSKRGTILNRVSNVGNFASGLFSASQQNIEKQKKPFFESILGVLERGAGIFGAVRNNQNQRVMEQQQTRRRNNTALIVGIALVAALIVGLLLFKNKKVIK